METETILVELDKLNNRLDDIDRLLKFMQADIAILRKSEIKERSDKYKTWPLDTDLDAEEAKELEEAKANATEEWKILNNIEKFIIK